MEKRNFNRYYNIKLKSIKAVALSQNILVKEYIRKRYNCNLKEYKEKIKKEYFEKKSCTAFLGNRCENKNIECYRCNDYLTEADIDKKLNKKK